MATIEEQIADIEKEIRETPYHKGTERHIGMLRARISKLKEKNETAGSGKSSGGGGYGVKKQGDATVVLVGPPSAGKSTLLNALTNAESKVAPYAFTTVSVIPGMMKYKDAYIQILDVPGLIEGAEEGKGRGREVISVVRGADLLVLMSDVTRVEAIERNYAALERNGIRIDKERPRVRIEKKLSGGLIIKSNIPQQLDRETMKEIAWEMGIKSAEISLFENLSMERLIDAFSRNRVYVPSIKLLNKAEDVIASEAKQSEKDRHAKLAMTDAILVSAEKNINLDEFRERVWKALNLYRVFLVRRDEEPSERNPLLLRGRVTLKEVAEKIGPEFAEEKKKAKIWGNGAKYEGQEVSLRVQIEDGMKIRFI